MPIIVYMQEWTKKLCFMDSDGDGRHNGIELGDPWCQWTKENNYPLQLATSHPGSLAPHPKFRRSPASYVHDFSLFLNLFNNHDFNTNSL